MERLNVQLERWRVETEVEVVMHQVSGQIIVEESRNTLACMQANGRMLREAYC